MAHYSEDRRRFAANRIETGIRRCLGITSGDRFATPSEVPDLLRCSGFIIS